MVKGTCVDDAVLTFSALYYPYFKCASVVEYILPETEYYEKFIISDCLWIRRVDLKIPMLMNEENKGIKPIKYWKQSRRYNEIKAMKRYCLALTFLIC